MKVKNYIYFVFAAIFFLNTNISCMNFFLQAPQELKKQELEVEKESRTISMCFGGKHSRWTYGYNKNSGVFIKYELADFPEGLDENIKKLFIDADKKSIKDGIMRQYLYGIFPEYEDAWENDYASYLAGDILEVKDCEKVEKIDCEFLEKFIKTKNIIFYTGAGISAPAGIFTMNQLVKALDFKDEDIFDKDLVCKIGKSAKAFEKFCDSMDNSPPTKAHKSLLELANYKKCKIVTENLDKLHQKTGIEPYIVFGDKFRQEVKNEWASEIDAIICCGLSHDDRGFLGWYKKHNPNGIIIAIDLGLPNYLGVKDFILNGDIQEVIPKICLAVKESGIL